MFLDNFISNVSGGASNIVGFFLNPIQTLTGASQGLVRGAVGSPLLTGSNTAQQNQINQTLQKRVSVVGTPSASPLLSTIQGIGSAISRTATNAFASISGNMTPATQKAYSTATPTTNVADRLLNTGLNAVDAFVQNLVGRGNTESPRPADITTGRFASTQDTVGYSQNPGIIPNGVLNWFSPNTGNGSTTGKDGSISVDVRAEQPNLMPLYVISAIGLGAFLLTRKK